MTDTSTDENSGSEENPTTQSTEDSQENKTESVWRLVDGDAKSPKQCPHCERPIAHPDDLNENDEIHVSSVFEAYRRHRKAHFEWGIDPRNDVNGYGDPYLGNYYKNDKNATSTSNEDTEKLQSGLDIVGHVFDVVIYYEVKKEARVVAPNAARAKEKVEYDELPDGVDLSGAHPDKRVTHQTHDETTKIKDVERRDTDLVERMET